MAMRSLVAFTAVCFVWCGSLSYAQDDASGASGRLPPYYKDVVSDTQTKEIYKIQLSFDDKLAALEKQYEVLSAEIKKVREGIDAIRYEERAAIEKVLTPKQLAQVKQMRAEAQAKLAQELLKAAEEAAKRAEELASPE